MYGQFEEGLGLLLSNQNGRVLNVLTPHLTHVAGTLGGIEQKVERQAFPCADGPVGLELGYA